MGFVIYAKGKGAPQVVHETLEPARAEAVRLSQLAPGTKFTIAQIVEEHINDASPEEIARLARERNQRNKQMRSVRRAKQAMWIEQQARRLAKRWLERGRSTADHPRLIETKAYGGPLSAYLKGVPKMSESS